MLFTPLAVLIGFSSMLKEKNRLNQQTKHAGISQWHCWHEILFPFVRNNYET